MKLIIFMNFFTNMIFLFMNHPLSLGLTLLIQTICISMMTSLFNFNYWFSYLLFLIMIGGMLILFMYMTNIASNKKIKLSINYMFMMMTFLIFLIPTYNLLDKNYTINNNYIYNKFINFPSNFMLMFIIMYLFLTLIACVKITMFKKGTFRKM